MNTQTEQQASPSPASDIWSVVVLMKDGSYAVIIFLLLIFVMTRKTAAEFFKEHLEIMKSLKESNDKNSDALEKTTKAVERISRNNTVLTTILAKHFNIDLASIKDDEV